MKTPTLYIATMNRPGVEEYVRANGITPDPTSGVVPLCLDMTGAIHRFLCDIRDNKNDLDVKKIKSVFVFTVELPGNTAIATIKSTRPELDQYTFIGYKGKLPPRFVTGSCIVDLENLGNGEEAK